jgi:hypothetical protein
MLFLWRWLKRAMLALAALVLLLLAPVVYTEFACRGERIDQTFVSQIAPEEHRPVAATFLTYPEWHIVFAYDDYAKVLETGDPHQYGYLSAITGFWSAMCSLTEKADERGGASETKNMDYVIGVSFTAELLAKAAYEETIGRVATWFRGEQHSVSDETSARMARAYAVFLHQVPWYKYDFENDVAALDAIGSLSFRDKERQFALGLEFGAKASYARVISEAVEATGQAKLTIRTVVESLDARTLRTLGDVTVIRASPEGVEIETPRYAAFTEILKKIALAQGHIKEIAGNNQIMITATGTEKPDILLGLPVLATLTRQGYNDQRWLVDVNVADLTNVIRAFEGSGATLEHVFDY